MSAARCRRKFLRSFPKGFYDETYMDWARNYKWRSHQTCCEQLDRAQHYCGLRDFAAQLRHDVRDLKPRDLIDVQSFIWVLGSDEY